MTLDPHQALKDQFQQLVSETSRRFVPQPSLEEVIADMGIMLKRFSNSCRWAEYFFRKEADAGNSQPEDDNLNRKGLDTDVRPIKTINAQAPLGSMELESFLDVFNRSVYHNLRSDRNVSNRSNEVLQLLHRIKRADDLVPLSTDKTNSFRLVTVANYREWMLSKIASMNATVVPFDNLKAEFSKAKDLFTRIQSIGPEFPISRRELNAIAHCLEKRSIPTPFLLSKDHKDPLPDGNFPTRFVLPAKSYNSMFAKVAYKAIKEIFDSHAGGSGVGYG